MKRYVFLISFIFSFMVICSSCQSKESTDQNEKWVYLNIADAGYSIYAPESEILNYIYEENEVKAKKILKKLTENPEYTVKPFINATTEE